MKASQPSRISGGGNSICLTNWDDTVDVEVLRLADSVKGVEDVGLAAAILQDLQRLLDHRNACTAVQFLRR